MACFVLFFLTRMFSKLHRRQVIMMLTKIMIKHIYRYHFGPLLDKAATCWIFLDK